MLAAYTHKQHLYIQHIVKQIILLNKISSEAPRTEIDGSYRKIKHLNLPRNPRGCGLFGTCNPPNPAAIGCPLSFSTFWQVQSNSNEKN